MSDRLWRVKQDNLARFERFVAQLRNGNTEAPLESLPLELYVELTRRCNLDCPMCSHKIEMAEHRALHGNEGLDFPAELLSVYEPLLPAAAMVYTVGIGEPTLYADLPKFVSSCTAQGAFVWTNSNGIALDERLCARLVASRLSRFVFSVSGGTKESYERYHRPAKWERLWKSLAALSLAKRRARTRWPELFLNFVVMDDNIRDLPALLARLSPFGFAGVTVKPVVNMKGVLDSRADAPQLREPSPADAALLGGLAEQARLMGLAWEDHSYLETHRVAVKRDGICLHPFSTLYLTPEGDVYPCGCGEGLNGAALCVGNVRETPIERIWRGEPLEALRKRILAANQRPKRRNQSEA